MASSIGRRDRELGSLLDRIERDYPEDVAEVLLGFEFYLSSKNRSTATRTNALRNILTWEGVLGEPFLNPSMRHMQDAIRSMDKRDMAPSTRNLLNTILKQFYGWHLGDLEVRPRRYPDCVRFLLAKPPPRPKMGADSLVSDQQYSRILRACILPQDLALFSLFYNYRR